VGALLVLASRLELSLLSVHPDKSAGPRLRRLFAAPVLPHRRRAGSDRRRGIANAVVHQGASLVGFKYVVGGLVVCVVVLFAAPLLAFTPTLVRVWHDGVRHYDELATMFGRRFEREWFDGHMPREHDDILERGDFSARTDLFQVVDRVHELSIVPVDLTSIGLLALSTLAPFLPVVLMALPLDEVLGALLGLVH
jgi:hypothetical protein